MIHVIKESFYIEFNDIMKIGIGITTLLKGVKVFTVVLESTFL